MELPRNRRYTPDHEWVKEEDGAVTVGITGYASDQLGDIVFVDLPKPGTDVYAGQVMGEVESTKSVSDVYSPVTGTISERNNKLDEAPELINEDPYGEGWLVKISAPQGSNGLLSAQDYKNLIEGAGH